MMLTLEEQLKADGYPIEYWFNVYPEYRTGFRYSSKRAIVDATYYITPKPLYRIHVRLK